MQPHHQKFIKLVALDVMPCSAFLQCVVPDASPKFCESGAKELCLQFKDAIETARREYENADKQVIINEVTAPLPLEMIPLNHLEFIELIAAGTDRAVAYRKTIAPNCLDNSAYSAALRMIKQYACNIYHRKRLRQEQILQAHQSEAVKVALQKVLTESEVDARLSAIINGQCGMNGDAGSRPTYVEMLKAIDMYYQRFGSYQQRPDQNDTKKRLVIHVPDDVKALPQSPSSETPLPPETETS